MIRNIFNKLREQYSFFVAKKGLIELTAGEYELFVYTKIKPHENVLFEVQEFGHHHTCSHLPKDEFKIVKKHDGFVLLAKVESSEVKIFWYVK